MEKPELELLEKAYNAEIVAAFSKNSLYMMQTRATKRADKLVADGLLRKVRETLAGRYTVEGYALTEAGRLAYCLTCDEPPNTHSTGPAKGGGPVNSALGGWL